MTIYKYEIDSVAYHHHPQSNIHVTAKMKCLSLGLFQNSKKLKYEDNIYAYKLLTPCNHTILSHTGNHENHNWSLEELGPVPNA